MRYNKTIAGRVSPSVRNKVRPLITEFATTNNLPFNTVFGAVIHAAERLKGAVSYARVAALVTPETVDAYVQELGRRQAARDAQIKGIIRKTLPVEQRTPDKLDSIFSQVKEFQGSIPALKNRVAELAT